MTHLAQKQHNKSKLFLCQMGHKQKMNITSSNTKAMKKKQNKQKKKPALRADDLPSRSVRWVLFF